VTHKYISFFFLLNLGKRRTCRDAKHFFNAMNKMRLSGHNRVLSGHMINTSKPDQK